MGPEQLLSRSPAQLPAGDWYSSHREKNWCVGKNPIGTRGKTLDWSLKSEEKIPVFVLERDTRTKVSESTEALATKGPYYKFTGIQDMDEKF